MNIYQYCEAMNVKIQCVYDPIKNVWTTNFHADDKVLFSTMVSSTSTIPNGSSATVNDSINKFAKIISAKTLLIKGASFLVPTLHD